MSPFDWFSVGVGVVSVLGVWLTGIAWWHGRTTNTLITSSAKDTQALMAQTTANTQGLLERMDQRADERHRETLQVLQALKR